MSADVDEFVHHPELRGKIRAPLTSWFRNFQPADLDAQMAAQGFAPDWRFTDAYREECRKRSLGERVPQDLWVFAYGSLMWDPGIRFAEVRRARAAGYARRFCLLEMLGARGTREAPGLLAALDHGGGCDGLAFRVLADQVDEETTILWRRELLMPGYAARFIDLETACGMVNALAFVADRSAEAIVPDLSRGEQVRYLATGTGFLGSSLQYLENLTLQLGVLGIEDADLLALLEEVRNAGGAAAAQRA